MESERAPIQDETLSKHASGPSNSEITHENYNLPIDVVLEISIKNILKLQSKLCNRAILDILMDKH